MTGYTIGRDAANDIVIEDSSVSRRHARIEQLGADRYAIFDQRSANGSFVLQDGTWHEFGEAEVGPTEPLRLGDHETTARDLMRRAVAPPAVGATVLADADQTEQAPSTSGGGATDPSASTNPLAAVWGDMAEYQKIAAIVGAAVIGLLLIAALVVAFI